MYRIWMKSIAFAGVMLLLLCAVAETEITVFAAKSLSAVMDTMIEMYKTEQPDVRIVASYDSSGTLMNQILAGAHCNVFFSAAQKQMDRLETEGIVIEGTRADIVNNQVCLVTWKGSGTEVTGLADMGKASGIAIADGSVPVGKYTRQALVSAGILPECEDVSAITTEEISEAFGGVEINACANVGAVAVAVSEGSDEIGTVYFSDTFGYEDRLDILEMVPYELTGEVCYPAAVIADIDNDAAQQEAAEAFVVWLKGDTAKEIFTDFHFDTNVD